MNDWMILVHVQVQVMSKFCDAEVDQVFAIGYMDITATLGGISLMQTGKEMETMMIVMGVYLVISLTISSFMNWFNQRIKLTER